MCATGLLCRAATLLLTLHPFVKHRALHEPLDSAANTSAADQPADAQAHRHRSVGDDPENRLALELIPQ